MVSSTKGNSPEEDTMSQTIDTARPIRLRYDLSQLHELRESGWNTHGGFITISATGPDGSRVSLTTNCVGEGEFSEDGLRQFMGTCQFSIYGWSDRRARAELRERYEELQRNREIDAFAREFDAELGIEED